MDLSVYIHIYTDIIESFGYSFQKNLSIRFFLCTCSPMPLIIQIRFGLSLDFHKLLCHTLLTHGSISVLAVQTKFTLALDVISLSNMRINFNDEYLTIVRIYSGE